MAMMMAGRVLLVCALCVLWCGAGGGYALFMNSSDTRYYYGPNSTYCTQYPNVFSSCSNAAGGTSSTAGGGVSGKGAEGSKQPSAGDSAGGQDKNLVGTASLGPQGDDGEGKLNQLGVGGATPPPPAPPGQPGPSAPPAPGPSTGPSGPSAPPGPTGPSGPSPPGPSEQTDVPNPKNPGESVTPGVTTETQSAEHSQPQSRMQADGSPATATLSSGGTAGGQAESPEENGSGRSEGDAGERELNQTDGSGTTTTPTATVTGAPPAGGRKTVRRKQIRADRKEKKKVHRNHNCRM
ncbi:mucin-associated surface protein (MASP), putative, partial [Trypanosoma cruzi marinkellei]